MTPAEKLGRLKAAYDGPNCQPVIDAFNGDEAAQDKFEWCATFLMEAKTNPTGYADLIDRIYDRTLTYTLLGN